jgi:hypothetical protein
LRLVKNRCGSPTAAMNDAAQMRFAPGTVRTLRTRLRAERRDGSGLRPPFSRRLVRSRLRLGRLLALVEIGNGERLGEELGFAATPR